MLTGFGKIGRGGMDYALLFDDRDWFSLFQGDWAEGEVCDNPDCVGWQPYSAEYLKGYDWLVRN